MVIGENNAFNQEEVKSCSKNMSLSRLPVNLNLIFATVGLLCLNKLFLQLYLPRVLVNTLQGAALLKVYEFGYEVLSYLKDYFYSSADKFLNVTIVGINVLSLFITQGEEQSVGECVDIGDQSTDDIEVNDNDPISYDPISCDPISCDPISSTLSSPRAVPVPYRLLESSVQV